MEEIDLLIIEDNRLLREGIKEMLEKQSDLKVEITTGNGENILKIVSTLRPKILLVDIGLPKHNDIELVTSLKAEHPDVNIIMMGLIALQDEALKYIEAGVSGFILKDATIEDFMGTIQSVTDGDKVLPKDMTKSLFSIIAENGIQKYGASKLIKSVRMTRREREVVALIAEGFANKEIADKLNLSVYTVKSHVHNILEKMALNTRFQIAIHARSNDNFDGTASSTPPLDD